MISNVISSLDRSSRLTDVLTNYNFHLLEVSLGPRGAVLSLSYGFKGITAPELSLSVKEIKPLHEENPLKIIDGGTWGEITLSRGVKIGDGDFYYWINSAMVGTMAFRRDFLLIQYSDIGLARPSPTTAEYLKIGGFQPVTELVSRAPARAWLLKECVPVNYKAGTDFDATSGELSIMELVLVPNSVQEFSLGGL